MTLDEMLVGMLDTYDGKDSEDQAKNFKNELVDVPEKDLKTAIMAWLEEKVYAPSIDDLREYVKRSRRTDVIIEGKKITLIGDPDKALKVYLGGEGHRDDVQH
jgi:hypothetical protein